MVVALVSSVLVVSLADGAAGQARGFDGTTIKVGGIGNPAQLAGAEPGAEGRIQRFNDDNEIKGVKIEYVGFADDKNDPATALAEARRLVTQEQVFAIVGDASSHNPYDFFEQNKVPFFGWGFEKAYCHPDITTKAWGFGFNSCQVNPDPTVVVDYGGQLYKYVSAELGKKSPTFAGLAEDTDTGKTTMKANEIGFSKAGFDVVYAEAIVPPPPGVGDYSPYVQELLKADNGNAPDVIRCFMGTACLTIYGLLQASGFTGIFHHSLYTDILVKPFGGSLATTANANIGATGIKALDQMKADVEKVKPGQKVDSGVIAGYGSTDMFIKALKKAAKGGKSGITPENVQKAASKMTWGLKDFVGPTVYPIGSNRQAPYCTSLVQSDGEKWVTLEEFSCSTKTYPFPS